MRFLPQVRKMSELRESRGDENKIVLKGIGQGKSLGEFQNHGSSLPMSKIEPFPELAYKSKAHKFQHPPSRDSHSPPSSGYIRHQIDKLKLAGHLESHKKIGKENRRPITSKKAPNSSENNFEQTFGAENDERQNHQRLGDIENLRFAIQMFPKKTSIPHFEKTRPMNGGISDGKLTVNNSTRKVFQNVKKVGDLDHLNDGLLRSSSQENLDHGIRILEKTEAHKPLLIEDQNRGKYMKTRPKRPRIYSFLSLRHLLGKPNTAKSRSDVEKRINDSDNTLHLLVNYSINAFPPDPLLLDLLKISQFHQAQKENMSSRAENAQLTVQHHFPMINKTTNENSTGRKDSMQMNLMRHFPLKMRLHSQAHPHPHKRPDLPNHQLRPYLDAHGHLYQNGYHPQTAHIQPFQKLPQDSPLLPIHQQLDLKPCSNFIPHHFELKSTNLENGTERENFRLVNDAFPVIIKMQNYTADNDYLLRQDENSNLSDETENIKSIPLSVIIDNLPQAQLLQKAIFYNNSLSANASATEIMKKTVSHWNAMIDNLQTVSSMFNGNFSNPCNIVCNTVNCSMIPCLRALQIMPQVYTYLFTTNDLPKRGSIANFQRIDRLQTKDQSPEQVFTGKSKEKTFKELIRTTVLPTERKLHLKTHENLRYGDKSENSPDVSQNLTNQPSGTQEALELINNRSQAISFTRGVSRDNQAINAPLHDNVYYIIQNDSMKIPSFIRRRIVDMREDTSNAESSVEKFLTSSATQSYEPATEKRLHIQQMILPVDSLGFPHWYDGKSSYDTAKVMPVSKLGTLDTISQQTEKQVVTNLNDAMRGPIMAQNAVLFPKALQLPTMSATGLKDENKSFDDYYYQFDDSVYPDLADEPTLSSLKLQKTSPQFQENFEAASGEEKFMNLYDRNWLTTEATESISSACNCEQSNPLQKSMKAHRNPLKGTTENLPYYFPNFQQNEESNFLRWTPQDWNHLRHKIENINWLEHIKEGEANHVLSPQNDQALAYSTTTPQSPISAPGYLTKSYHPNMDSSNQGMNQPKFFKPKFSTIDSHGEDQTTIGLVIETGDSGVGANQYQTSKKQQVKVDDDVSELILSMPQNLPKMTFLFRQVNMKPVSSQASCANGSDKTFHSYDKPPIIKTMFSLQHNDTPQILRKTNTSKILNDQSTPLNSQKSWVSKSEIKLDDYRGTAPFMSFKNEVMGQSSYAGYDYLSNGDSDYDTVALPNKENRLRNHSEPLTRSRGHGASLHRSRPKAKYGYHHYNNRPGNKVNHKSIQGHHSSLQNKAVGSQSSRIILKLEDSKTTIASYSTPCKQNNSKNRKLTSSYPNSEQKGNQNTTLCDSHKNHHNGLENASKNYSKSFRHRSHHMRHQIFKGTPSGVKQQRYSPRMRGFIKYFRHFDPLIGEAKNAQIRTRPKGEVQPMKNGTILSEQVEKSSLPSQMNFPTVTDVKGRAEPQTKDNTEHFTQKDEKSLSSDKELQTGHVVQTLSTVLSTTKFPANTTFLFDEDEILQEAQGTLSKNAAKTNKVNLQIQIVKKNSSCLAEREESGTKISHADLLKKQRDGDPETDRNYFRSNSLGSFSSNTKKKVGPAQYKSKEDTEGVKYRDKTIETSTSLQSTIQFGGKLEDEEHENMRDNIDETKQMSQEGKVNDTKVTGSNVLDKLASGKENAQSLEEISVKSNYSLSKLDEKKIRASSEYFTDTNNNPQHYFTPQNEENVATNTSENTISLMKHSENEQRNKMVKSSEGDPSEKSHPVNSTLKGNGENPQPDETSRSEEKMTKQEPVLVPIKKLQGIQNEPRRQNVASDQTTVTVCEREMNFQILPNKSQSSRLILMRGQKYYYYPHTFNVLTIPTTLSQDEMMSPQQAMMNQLDTRVKYQHKPLKNLDEPSVIKLIGNTTQSMKEMSGDNDVNTPSLSPNITATISPNTDDNFNDMNQGLAIIPSNNLRERDDKNRYTAVRDKRVKSKEGLIRNQKVYAQIHSDLPFSVDNTRVYHAIKVPSSIITPYLTLATGPLRREGTNNLRISALRNSIHAKPENNVCILVKSPEQSLAKVGQEKKKSGRIEQFVRIPNFMSRRKAPTQIAKFMVNPREHRNSVAGGQKTAVNISKQLAESKRTEIIRPLSTGSCGGISKSKESHFNSKLYLIPFQKLRGYSLFKTTQDRTVKAGKNSGPDTLSNFSTVQSIDNMSDQTENIDSSKFQSVDQETITMKSSSQDNQNQTQPGNFESSKLDPGGERQFPSNVLHMSQTAAETREKHQETNDQIIKPTILDNTPKSVQRQGSQQTWDWQVSQVRQSENHKTSDTTNTQTLLNINNGSLGIRDKGPNAFFGSPKFKYYYITIKPEMIPRVSQYIQFVRFATPTIVRSQTSALISTAVPANAREIDKHTTFFRDDIESKTTQSRNLSELQRSDTPPLSTQLNHDCNSDLNDGALPLVDAISKSESILTTKFESTILFEDKKVAITDSGEKTPLVQLMVESAVTPELKTTQNATAGEITLDAVEVTREDKYAKLSSETESRAGNKNNKTTVNSLNKESVNATKDKEKHGETISRDQNSTNTMNQNLNEAQFDGANTDTSQIKLEVATFSGQDIQKETGTIKEGGGLKASNCSAKSSNIEANVADLLKTKQHETEPDKTRALPFRAQNFERTISMNSSFIDQRSTSCNNVCDHRSMKSSSDKKKTSTTLSVNAIVTTLKPFLDKNAQIPNSIQLNQAIESADSSAKTFTDKIETKAPRHTGGLTTSEPISSKKINASGNFSSCSSAQAAGNTNKSYMNQTAYSKNSLILSGDFPEVRESEENGKKIVGTKKTSNSFLQHSKTKENDAETSGEDSVQHTVAAECYNDTAMRRKHEKVTPVDRSASAKQSDNFDHKTEGKKKPTEQTDNKSQTDKNEIWDGKDNHSKSTSSMSHDRDEASKSDLLNVEKGTEDNDRDKTHANLDKQTTIRTSRIAENNSLSSTAKFKDKNGEISPINNDRIIETAKFQDPSKRGNETMSANKNQKLQKKVGGWFSVKQAGVTETKSNTQNKTGLIFPMTTTPKFFQQTAVIPAQNLQNIDKENSSALSETQRTSQTKNLSVNGKSVQGFENRQNEHRNKTQDSQECEKSANQNTPCATLKCSTVKICSKVISPQPGTVTSAGLQSKCSEASAKSLRTLDNWMTPTTACANTTAVDCAKTQCVIFQKDNITERMSICLNERSQSNFFTTLADKLSDKFSSAQAILRYRIFGTSSQTESYGCSPVTNSETISVSSSIGSSEGKMTISTSTDGKNQRNFNSRSIFTFNETTATNFDTLADTRFSIQTLAGDTNKIKAQEISKAKISDSPRPVYKGSQPQVTTNSHEVIAHTTSSLKT